jgi:hypothetical protein
VFSGFYEKVIVAFSWCLARADEKPDEFNSVELLWKYKWVLEHLDHFPGISREKFFSSIEDFKTRCLKEGWNERSALALRWRAELNMGHTETAKQTFAKWKRTTRDGMSDCRACEVDQAVWFYATIGEHDKAISTAKPIISGHLRCAEVPHHTHATLLRSLWLTGRHSEAEQHHVQGYRLVRSNRDFLREQAWHLGHLLRSRQLEPASALVRKHLPWALDTRSLDFRFYFLVPARLCVERLIDNGVSSLRCRLPEGIIPGTKKTVIALPNLAAWMEKAIPELAAKFDQRNGNSFFASFASTAPQEHN